MPDYPPSPKEVRTLAEVKRVTTDAMLDQGVLRYWQHDTRSVMHEGQPWAYTCGRTLFGRPELLVTGLGEAVSLNLLAELGSEDVHPDRPMVTTSVGPVAFVLAETGLLHATYAVFGSNYSALQVVWRGDPQPIHTLGGLILTDPYPEETHE